MVCYPGNTFSDFYSSLLKFRAGTIHVLAATCEVRMAKIWCLVWGRRYHGKGKNLRNEESFRR